MFTLPKHPIIFTRVGCLTGYGCKHLSHCIKCRLQLKILYFLTFNYENTFLLVMLIYMCTTLAQYTQECTLYMYHVALEIYNCPYQTQLPLGFLMLYTFCVTTIPTLHVKCISTTTIPMH